MTTIALGIPVVLWTLALVTVAVILLLCGCAGIGNHDAYWNKAYLATPMGAVAESQGIIRAKAAINTNMKITAILKRLIPWIQRTTVIGLKDATKIIADPTV